MTRAIVAVVVEVLALGAICVVLRWANKLIDQQLAGATPARVPREGARTEDTPDLSSKTPASALSAFPQPSTPTPAVCAGCGLEHGLPHHVPIFVCLYMPWAGGFVAHHFVMKRGIAAAHVALYRVPRFGEEARA